MAKKKIDREEVYNKCDGHCAYCGNEITIKQMQIDHIEPVEQVPGVDHNNIQATIRTQVSGLVRFPQHWYVAGGKDKTRDRARN